MKNSMQKIQDTLTSWGRKIWKCRSAGVLSQEEGVHLFDSISSNLLSTQESKEPSFCWVDTERENGQLRLAVREQVDSVL